MPADDPYAQMLRAQLVEYIRAKFPGDASASDIREAVLSDPNLATLEQEPLRFALEDVLSTHATVASPSPRLLVDWGELPQVGREARPLFSLIGPGSYSRPNVKISIDRSLDNDPTDPLRQLRAEELGLWTFYVPFRLTTSGLEARPGLYVIDVEVTFPDDVGGLPRFLQTRIRLNVPDGNSDRRELVIDGDGQSVVNLAGHDLRSFSRVVLKGDDKSIINLQNFSQQLDTASPTETPESVVYEYALKLNRDIHDRLPAIVSAERPTKTDAITLCVGDRRLHLLARRRVTFGRSRENDICLRFLPRSPENDNGSRGISRMHMAFDLTDEGLVLADENSSKGVDVDCDPVNGSHTFHHYDSHGTRHLDVPSPLVASQSLEMEMTVFGQDPLSADFRSQLEWDDICFQVASEPPSRLWQLARQSGIEAVRFRRLNNLCEEEYVLLYRQATIGRSAKDAAIGLPEIGQYAADVRVLYIGRSFWLHSGGRVPVVIDGQPIQRPFLHPLTVGEELQVGQAKITVERFAQLWLEDQ